MVKLSINIIFVILCFFIATSSSLAYDLSNKKDELWSRFNKETVKEKQTATLFELADYYNLCQEFETRDSTLAIAVEIAKTANDESLEVKIYCKFFEADDFSSPDLTEKYSTRLLYLGNNKNNNEWLYFAYAAIAKNYMYNKVSQQALLNANRAFQYVNMTGNNELKARCLLLLGDCSGPLNLKIEAFRDYCEALNIARKDDDSALEFTCYQKLYDFYRLINNFEKAFYFKRLQLASCHIRQPEDSIRLMQLNNDLANIYYLTNNPKQAIKITHDVISFALRYKLLTIKDAAFTIYRSYLVNNNAFKDLYNLYINEYPEELSLMAKNQPVLFYRIGAYIQEAKGNIDSAAAYYKMAEDGMTARVKDKIVLSNFFMRYGQFFLRINNLENAKSKFEQSLQFAAGAGYYPFALQSTHYLDSISNDQKNYEAAYKYAKLYKLYTDSQATALKDDDLLRMEINNEDNQRKIDEQKEELHTERKHSIQYIGITIFIATTFVILAMLGSFKVPKIWIKLIGFFSFILLFEFIIMVTDAKVEVLTHEEPLKILAFKILIIIILTPIHHWLEHKVLEYLYEHKLLETTKLKLKHVFLRKPNHKNDEPENKPE